MKKVAVILCVLFISGAVSADQGDEFLASSKVCGLSGLSQLVEFSLNNGQVTGVAVNSLNASQQKLAESKIDERANCNEGVSNLRVKAINGNAIIEGDCAADGLGKSKAILKLKCEYNF